MAIDGLAFVADITAVLDRGLHRDNPFDSLQEQFSQRQKKFGLLDGGYDVRVNSYPINHDRGSGATPRLKLPRIADFPTKIFNARF